MSIYSGFATRQQEHAYDHLLLDLIMVLQKRVIKFYTGEDADEPRFHNIITNLQSHLAKMEESKYLEPKLAPILTELVTITTAASDEMAPVPNHPTPLTTPVAKLPSKPSRSYSSKQYQSKNTKYGKIKHQ